MRSARHLVSLGFALVVSLVIGRAAGQDTPDNVAPERRVQVCESIFEEAQLKERRAKLVFARQLYGQCASTHCPTPLRNDCIEKRDALDRALPTVTFAVRDAAGNDAPATYRVDGEPFRVSPGRASPIDPGPHDVEYMVSGQPTGTMKITIHEGEKSRLVLLPPTARPASGLAQQQGANPAPEERSAAVVGPAIVGVVGLVGALLGVGALALSANESEKADEQAALAASLPPGPQADETAKSSRSHESAAEDNAIVGGLFVAGGVLMIGGAIVWHLLTRPSSKPKTAWIRPLGFAF